MQAGKMEAIAARCIGIPPSGGWWCKICSWGCQLLVQLLTASRIALQPMKSSHW